MRLDSYMYCSCLYCWIWWVKFHLNECYPTNCSSTKHKRPEKWRCIWSLHVIFFFKKQIFKHTNNKYIHIYTLKEAITWPESLHFNCINEALSVLLHFAGKLRGMARQRCLSNIGNRGKQAHNCNQLQEWILVQAAHRLSTVEAISIAINKT